MKKVIIVALIAFLGGAGYYWYAEEERTGLVACSADTFVCADGSIVGREGPSCAFAACPDAGESRQGTASDSLPIRKNISGLDHAWQSFNNCSSVALVVALSKYGIADTQEAIAEATRPWNNPKGDNDDKSVTLYEMADYVAEEHGLVTYVRPNGTIELLREFVANDIPVIARALMFPDKDYVHYRVVKGYDAAAQTILESDGIEGPNQVYSYEEWQHLWKEFNYSYLIVVPESGRALVERILGEERDARVAWEGAKARAEAAIAANPADYRAHYNLVTALHHLGDHEGAVREFEKIEPHLSAHKLWYQDEPIYSHYELGNHDRALALIEETIGDRNKSVSELYVLRGRIYLARGDEAAAREEFEKALYYNKYLASAKAALAALSTN